MKKILTILLIMLLSGCSGNIDIPGELTDDDDLTPVKGGSIQLFCDMPDTLNPIVTGYKSVSEVMYLVYDGLFRTENDFSASPVLSSGYTAQNGNRRYVVRLKKGVKFHDGTDLDAGDVVATMDRIRRSNSKYNVNLSNVVSYSVGSDGSLLFELATPQTNFVNLLDFPVMPSEATESDFALENKYFSPVGTGRFKVESMDAMTLTLKKNDNYHGDKPYVDNVVVNYVQDSSTAKYSFEAMEFDVITTDLYSWGDTSMSGFFNTTEYESNRLTYLGINCANSALSDKAVRRAISSAADREEIVSEIMFTHAAKAYSPVNPNAFFANKEYVPTAYESGKAMEELKGAGWLDLDGDGVLDKYFDERQLSLSFNLIVNNENPTAAKLAAYLAENMLAEGIYLNVVELDYLTYVAAVQNGEFDIFIGRTDITNDCDVSFMLRGDGVLNYFNYSSSAMNSAIDDIRTSDGTHDVKAAYKAFDAVFKEELPVVPLYFETDAVFSSVRLKGDLNISRTGIFTGLHSTFVKYKD